MRWALSVLLAHAQLAALTAVIATDTARHLTDARAVALAHGAALGATVLAFFADHYHQHRLCPRCAAATPIDGPAAAKRHHRWLLLHHWAAERLGYPLILIAAAVAYFGLGVPHWVTFYPVYALWALVAYANLRHRPVEPWCPHCGWGGGGDDETDPVPPPMPAAEATRSRGWSTSR